MSKRNTERLFYVVKESDTTYSLYSIQTDYLILAEVAANAISDFLLLNEPHNPALSFLDKIFSYPSDLNGNSKYALNYYATDSFYLCYNPYEPTKVTQWGIDSLKDYNLDDTDKQLSFNFSSNPEEKCETNLTNSSNLYIVTDKSDDPKAGHDSESEWKELNIDDD